MPEGPKGTKGPFVWGKNRSLYYKISRQKILAEEIFSLIKDQPVQWLLPPDPIGERRVIAWTQAEQPAFVFVANMNPKTGYSGLQISFPEGNWQLCFSTEKEVVEAGDFSGVLPVVGAGEGLVWRFNE